ncbi:LytR cell envelope-related transcriptional attenuator [Curtobacterium sp. 314Chir4.1]|uniref:LytR C-terminal domain-containing protein n=1 Tax=Curtobacterium sp. 314Chir4.1 TaxID=1279028 RepID=UPI000BD2287E|nr:LytR C-terminal domain-containing protein [Curtobacterium sp. 314Chir4.1]SOC88968.1 LytR cell envelope-related transcriptional attenuator [Curtobacterium sp. 314Chir4.1]
MTTRYPRDRFDDVADGPRVGAHRGAQRRGRGWIAFAWAALATGVLVGIGVLVLALLNGSYSFDGSTSPSASSSASASATAEPSSSPSSSAPQAPAAGTPADQGTTSVVVLNGTTTTGLAAKASAALTSAGWKVTSTGDAGTTGTTATIVYYQQAAQASVAQGIAKSLGVTAVQQSAAFPNADISVVLGADYAG